MLQKANEFCNDVKGLGNELLTALEKKDAEQLSLLRSGNELNLLAAIRDIKVSQVDEANENLDSLNKPKDVIQAKRDYYGSRVKKSNQEQEHIDLLTKALRNQELEIANEILASILVRIPQSTVGLMVFWIYYWRAGICRCIKIYWLPPLGMLANYHKYQWEYGRFRRQLSAESKMTGNSKHKVPIWN